MVTKVNKKQYFLLSLRMCSIFLFFLSLLLSTLYLYDKYHVYKNQQEPTPEINFATHVLLGLAPNTFSRVPTNNDLDTRLNINTNNGEVYRLFQSKSWDKGDYDKTFVVRIK